MNIRFATTLNKPRPTVWRAFDNPENLALWQPTLISFSQISGSASQAGAVAKIVYKEKDRLVEMTETISLRKEPEIFCAIYDSAFAANMTDNHFIEIDQQRTQWILHAHFNFKGVWKLLAPLMKTAIRKRTENDMLRFKTLLEENQLAS